jgi:Rho GTPase-activating protein 22/24/25
VQYNLQSHTLYIAPFLNQAWFRELPEGVLDSLSPEQVLHCNTEEECIELVKLLPPTQAALLNWVVELMTDVVEEEESNKMNARNVAMVFAPNMTQVFCSSQNMLTINIS